MWIFRVAYQLYASHLRESIQLPGSRDTSINDHTQTCSLMEITFL